MAGQTIFDIVRKGERERPGFSVLWIKPENVSRVAREIRDSIPTTHDGQQCFEIDMKSAIVRGNIRISKTTIRVRE